MQFELTREYLNSIREHLKNDDRNTLEILMAELHPADIAEIFDEMKLEEAISLYSYIDKSIAADILIEMDEDIREQFLSSLTPTEIAHDFIQNLDSDDAADVVQELSPRMKEDVISAMTDEEHASEILDLLSFPEESAGGLMAKELIKVELGWNVLKCVKEMRKQAADIENVYTIYVVDSNNKLMGTLSLKRLLLADTRAKVDELYNQNVQYVRALDKSEDVASIMEKYDLVVLPVIDELNRLIGRITIDDIVDVIREEADKNYQMASGISETVESSAGVFQLSRARLPWLLIGLVGGITSSMIIGQYEDQLRIQPEMALFIPLIAAMGGNVGIQSSAIIVQGLAKNTLGFNSVGKRLFKELRVGLTNGFICSILIFVYNYFSIHHIDFALTVSISLMSAIIYAGIFGTIIPLMLARYNIDPALATGPFIATMNDIVGIFIYFGIGHLLYGVL